MRRNLFLHFLNRDTREIFGVYDNLTEADHQHLLRRVLNAAIALCEDRCIVPPGFIVEDTIVFELAEAQRAYLQSGVLQFPMRENNLAEFAEKKRVGYEPMRNRYSGLFDDTRIGFLGENATGIIGRRSHITENIFKDWRAGPEENKKIWKPVKTLLTPLQVDVVSNVPTFLNERGIALTWSAIEPELSDEMRLASSQLRDVLQNVYLQQYCTEFDLIVLTDLPHMPLDFMLPNNRRIYSYRRLESFLDTFYIKDLVLDGPADLIIEFRKRQGFISFMDAFAGLANVAATNTDLKFLADRARKQTTFKWATISERRTRIFDLLPIEITELDDVFSEAANVLVQQNDLPVRAKVPQPGGNQMEDKGNLIISSEPDLVIFVALAEELDTLTGLLNLDRNSGSPAASGKNGDTLVDIVCPRNMGRVAASIEMSKYLSERNSSPKLALILGLAGGFIENDSEQGHIVCVTKVVDMAIRKVVEDENGASPKFRREDYRMDRALEQVIGSDTFDENKWSTEACGFGWPSDRRPSIHYGPVASVDEVVASDEWRKKMLSGEGGESKLLGVEMEAGGVCAAAVHEKVPFCMLRVISDQADPSKTDDKWRSIGMRTLALLVAQLPLAEVLEQV